MKSHLTSVLSFSIFIGEAEFKDLLHLGRGLIIAAGVAQLQAEISFVCGLRNPRELEESKEFCGK